MRIAGEEYEIVGSTVISPKNFVSMEPEADVVVELASENATTTTKEETTAPPPDSTTPEPDTKTETTTEAPVTAEEFKCSVCGKICLSKGGLSTHRKTHKK